MRGASVVLLVAAPLLGTSQQTPAAWPKPGQLVSEGLALHDKENYPEAIAKYSAVTPGDSLYATAQSELALSLYSAGKLEEAAAAARRAIALQPFNVQGYNILANAQEDLKQVDAALATYKQGLRLFPYNQNLYYNLGITYLRQSRAAEALTNLQRSLELNPTHPGTHRLLAVLAAEQGQVAHALMSWLTYLALSDAGPTSHDVLVQAERLSNGMPVVLDSEKVKPVAVNNDFVDLDQLLESKVALQKSYVSKVKVEAAVVKQAQLLVEKFPVTGSADDFWIRAYGPMVAALRQKDNLTAFTYLFLQSADDAKAKQWVKSNKSKVDAMLLEALTPLVALRAQQQVVGQAPGQRLAAWFNERLPEGLGPGVTEKGTFRSTGDWISLDQQGAIDAKGRFNAAGQRVGLWSLLRPDGTVDKTFVYNDKGEREGPAREFHANGQPSLDLTYRADKAEGVLTIYNECGARTTSRSFRAGDLEGPYATYYDSGQLRMRTTLHADKQEGLEEGFYQDGTPEYTTTMAGCLKQGPFATYFPDKTLERKGTSDKDSYDGPFTEYFATSAVKEEGRYAHGKHVGTWRTYFSNGTVSGDRSSDEAGEYHGLYHDYDETGRLYCDTEYAHGRVVHLRYLDKAGKVLLDQAVKKGLVRVQTPNAEGGKNATGSFLDGQLTGDWQWFYPDGGVREASHYDAKGNKTGPSLFYYRGGQLQRRTHFSPEAVEDGYHEQFTLDGRLTTAGYYHNGQRHGQWKDYYTNGRVSEEYEYYKGEQNGPSRSYETGGKLTQERLNEFGKLRRLTAYDSVGQVLTTVELKPDSKGFSLRYPSGKPLYRSGLTCYNSSGPATWLRPDGSAESSFAQVEGRRHGPYTATFANGKPERQGTYRNGQAHGEWLTSYANGQPRSKGRYANGELEGEWTHYFPNGQLETTQHYQEGELHGASRHYNPAGELLVEKTYEQGALVSYRGPAAQAAWQPLPNSSGTVATAFASGRPAVAETYDHGLAANTATLYYASGDVFRRSTFAQGVRTGRLESFYPGGKPLEQESYLHGELHGRCRYFRPDGTLEREETYRSGERSGPTTYFDAAGKPQRTEMYWNQMVYDKK